MEQATYGPLETGSTIARTKAEAFSTRLANVATEAGLRIDDPLHIDVAGLMVDCAAAGVDPVRLWRRATTAKSVNSAKEA